MDLFTFRLKRILLFISLVLFILLSHNVSSQVLGPYTVDINPTAQQLVDILVGTNLQTSNAVLRGLNMQSGQFWGTSNIGFESGIILTTGDARKSKGPNLMPNAGTNHSPPPPGITLGYSDPDLTQLGNGMISIDACVLEFDFIAESSAIEFRYVFGSDEYMEYVSGNYNDVFAFFLSGPDISGTFSLGATNIAIIPESFPPQEVSIKNVNANTNSQYYISNPEGSNTTIQYDGFTHEFIAKRGGLKPCHTYHIKLAIGDRKDGEVDSGVFLKENSFTSVGLVGNLAFTHVEVDTIVEGCNKGIVTFSLAQIATEPFTTELILGGSADDNDYIITGDNWDPVLNRVTIPIGQISTTIEIEGIDGDGLEDNEDILLIYNTSLCRTVYDTIPIMIKDKHIFTPEYSPDQQIVCGETANLWVSAVGGQQPYYFNWSTGETTEQITVQPNSTTTYNVSVLDICGQGNSYDITIYVIGPTADACPDFPICQNDPANLSVQGGTSWLWTSSPTDPSLVGHETEQNPVVYPLSTTTYSVTVYDACGNEDSDQVVVSVDSPYADAGDDGTICKDDVYQLTANYTPNGVYVWTDLSTGAVVGNAQMVDVSPATTTTYRVSVTDNCGNTLTDDVTINVVEMFVSVCPDKTICRNDPPVELTATSSLGGGVFLWSDGTNTYPGQTIYVSPSVTTTYIVTVDDGCVRDGDPVTVTVNQLPLVDATTTLPDICPDESTTLNAAGAVNYVWTAVPADASLVGQENSTAPSVSPTVTTTYTLTGTDGNTCVNTDQISITVKPRMFADFNISNTGICEGEDLNITYTGNGNASANYAWNFDGGVSTGTNMNPIVHWSTMGTKNIRLVVTQNGCSSEEVVRTVTVNQMPAANFSQDIAEGCVPLTVNFTNLSSNTTPSVTYNWNFGAGSSTSVSPGFTFETPGTYDVKLTASNGGCINEKSVTALIKANPVPVASFTADPKKISLRNPFITFTSTSPDGNLTYNWTTGDGNVYSVPAFVHTYADSGTFVVQMQVTNEFGCVNTMSETIIITPRYMLRIPTAFTPNNDGLNDVFKVIGTGVKKYRISIFNKWGSLIFTTEDINNSWDGTINGQPALPGLYIYRTYFMDENDEVSEQTGSFSLIK